MPVRTSTAVPPEAARRFKFLNVIGFSPSILNISMGFAAAATTGATMTLARIE
jgi:hypothetical protein